MENTTVPYPTYPPGNGVSYRWRIAVNAAVNIAFAALAVGAWKIGAHELALVLGGTTGLYRVTNT